MTLVACVRSNLGIPYWPPCHVCTVCAVHDYMCRRSSSHLMTRLAHCQRRLSGEGGAAAPGEPKIIAFQGNERHILRHFDHADVHDRCQVPSALHLESSRVQGATVVSESMPDDRPRRHAPRRSRTVPQRVARGSLGGAVAASTATCRPTVDHGAGAWGSLIKL